MKKRLKKWTSDLREIEKRMVNAGIMNATTIWPEDLIKITKKSTKK